MATNEILRFAETDTGTNLLTQAEYLADSQRPIGNQPGVARSKLVNKALRQASLIAAGLAEYIADNQANNITDSLTPQNIADYLQAAITGALGVTPPQFDNDTSLATTAFVQRAIGNFAGVTSVSSATTLAAADWGKLVSASSAAVANFNLTLPPISGVTNGAAINFTNNSAYSVTFLPNGSDLMYVAGIGGAQASFVVLPGDSAIIYKGSSFTVVIGGSSQLKYAGVFGSSLAGNGYQKLPSGLIIQWGSASASATAGQPVTITLPIANPTATRSINITRTGVSVGADFNTFATSDITATNFVVRSQVSGTPTFFWMAIGY